jgi:hypothetical protein
VLGLNFAETITVRSFLLNWLWRIHHYSLSGTDDDWTISIPEAEVTRPWDPPGEDPGAEAQIPVVRGYVVLS